MNAARKQQKISPLPSSSSSSPPNASSRSAGAGSVGNKNETLATTSSSTGALGDRDVGDIVLKAKRAAASLWMVLHAQSCSLTNTAPPGHAPGSRHRHPICCPHRGCDDMKRLLRHIRGCPASFDQLDCPRDYPGCCSVRKLMAHHKRCRALRLAASRRQSPSCTSSFPSPPPPCLICSLVARHARNILEGGSAPSPPSAGRRRDISARPRSASAAVGEAITSGSCPPEDDSASMPPPPPRRPRAASDIPVGIRNRGSNDTPQVNSDIATAACSSSSCSPPNESHLMRNRETRRIWTALASATGPAPCVGGGLLEHSPDLLSRSFDSSSSRRVVVTPPAKRRMGSSPLRGAARGINNKAECKASRSECVPSLCTEGASSKEDASLSSQPVTSASPSYAEREGSRKRRQDPASPATLTRQYQQRPRSKSEGGPSSPPPTRGTRAVMKATETRHHQQDDCTAVDNLMRSTDRPATSANGAATLLSFHRRSRSFSELEESHIWSDHQHQQRTSYSAVYRREEEAASELHLRMDAVAAGRGGGFGADSGIECRGSEGADDVEGNEGEETGGGGGGGASLSITGRSSSCGVLSALAHPE